MKTSRRRKKKTTWIESDLIRKYENIARFLLADNKFVYSSVVCLRRKSMSDTAEHENGADFRFEMGWMELHQIQWIAIPFERFAATAASAKEKWQENWISEKLSNWIGRIMIWSDGRELAS